MATYTITLWTESTMTAGAKLAGLIHMETIYDSIVIDIDAEHHVNSYYNKTECDNKYFHAGEGGADSGLICQLLDGHSVSQILAAGAPPGSVAMWYGTKATIPTGWVACDGHNGTYDMRTCQVLGAGSTYTTPGQIVGENYSVITNADISITGHILDVTEIPQHMHEYTDLYGVAGLSVSESGTTGFHYPATDNARTTTVEAGSPHEHNATFRGVIDNRGPFIALWFIMKVEE